MTMPLTNDLESQLQPYLIKIEELHQWIAEHEPWHKDFEQKRRELSIAITKIEQTKLRYKRPNKDLPIIYSVPKFNN